MVRAILEGRKTQTRRVVDKFFPRMGPDGRPSTRGPAGCRFGRTGDLLWVRETWNRVYDCPSLPCCEDGEGTHARIVYRATEPNGVAGYCRSFEDERDATWRPSIFMPREASRLTLEVTDVREERLQDISEEDAKAEGCADVRYRSPREEYSDLWDSLNAKRAPWASNPWVWVVCFRRLP
jgi:hypothetical protein